MGRELSSEPELADWSELVDESVEVLSVRFEAVESSVAQIDRAWLE